MGTAVRLWRFGQLVDDGLHLIHAQHIAGAWRRVAGYGGGDGLSWCADELLCGEFVQQPLQGVLRFWAVWRCQRQGWGADLSRQLAEGL